MKQLAYLILAHQDPRQFGRLVHALGKDCEIYVHVDAKSDLRAFAKAAGDRRVVFTRNRFTVSWAGIRMVDAEMELIRTALEHSRHHSHQILLSGADYPVRPQEELVEFLRSHGDAEHLNFLDMRESPDVYALHVSKKHFREPLLGSRWPAVRFVDRALRKALRSLALPNPWREDVVPCFGSQWFCLTRACAAYVLTYHEDNPWFRELNRQTMSPDEHYIHTIVGNSRFLEAAGGFQPFARRGTWRMANLHVIHPSLRKWYTLDDWDEVAATDRFFLRKVRTADAEPLLDRIDEEFLRRDPDQHLKLVPVGTSAKDSHRAA